MAKGKPRKAERFRSVLEVKRAYLPELLKSQSGEDVQELIERTANVTEQALRRRVKK